MTQDPRNVTDKGVMRQYINNIVEYLAEQQYHIVGYKIIFCYNIF